MKKHIAWLWAAAAIGASGAGVAHHSAAGYDTSKTVVVTGTVDQWKFVNPHSWIYLTATDAAGKEVHWELEGGSPSHLARNGYTFKTMKKGDKVSVLVAPRSDGAPLGLFTAIKLEDGTIMGSMGPAPAGAFK